MHRARFHLRRRQGRRRQDDLRRRARGCRGSRGPPHARRLDRSRTVARRRARRPLGRRAPTIPLRAARSHAVEIDAPRGARRAGWRHAAQRARTDRPSRHVARRRRRGAPAAAVAAGHRRARGAARDRPLRGRPARYDVIVVDTAPTGHTLRMLGMPDTLGGVARAFDGCRRSIAPSSRRFAAGGRRTRRRAHPRKLEEGLGQLADLCRNRERARFYWITLPEEMAVEETADALSALGDAASRCTTSLVNRITTPAPDPVRWCDARREPRRIERRALARAARRRFLTSLAVRDAEPRGRPCVDVNRRRYRVCRATCGEAEEDAVARWSASV